jgi:hypothetical protein
MCGERVREGEGGGREVGEMCGEEKERVVGEMCRGEGEVWE